MLNSGLRSWLQVLITYVGFLCLGLCSTVIGPSLVHLEFLLDTETKYMGLSYMCGGIGYIAGSFLCAVVFDRLNSDIQLSLMCTLMAVFTTALPWMPSLIPFIAVAGLQAVSMSFFEPAADSYAIARCTNENWRKPVVTGLHATWSLGATLTPIILSPFLIDLPSNQDIRADNFTGNTSNSNMTSAWSNTDLSEITNTELEGLTNIRYGFIILGASAILPAILYATSFVITMKPTGHSTNSQDKTSPRSESTKEPFTTNVPLMILLCLNYCILTWYMEIPSSYLTTFTVKFLGWSSSTGSLTMSIYWGSHALSRLIGIPISYVLPPSVMVLMNIVLSLFGFVLMFFVQSTPSVYLMWVSTVLIGLGLGTTYSSMMLWAAQHIKVTGRVSATFYLSMCVSSLVCNPMMGYILSTYSYQWFIRSGFLTSLLHLILFITMCMYMKFKHQPSTNTEFTESEVQVEDKDVQEHLLNNPNTNA